MVKPESVHIVLGVIFESLQEVDAYNKYPKFKAMTQSEYSEEAQKRSAIMSAFGIYKKGRLVGGAYFTIEGEGHIAVKKEYKGKCLREFLTLIEYGFSKFKILFAKVDIDNTYILRLARRLGAKWVIHEDNDEGCRAVLVLTKKDLEEYYYGR